MHRHYPAGYIKPAKNIGRSDWCVAAGWRSPFIPTNNASGGRGNTGWYSYASFDSNGQIRRHILSFGCSWYVVYIGNTWIHKLTHPCLGDGQFYNFKLDTREGRLWDKKRSFLGKMPIALGTFSSNDTTHVFAASDKPSVIHSRNQKLIYSNVNLKVTFGRRAMREYGRLNMFLSCRT